MRVFTFISKSGDSLALAQRVQEEGHRVIFYANDKMGMGEGLVETLEFDDTLIINGGDINQYILSKVMYPKPDCVVMDSSGWGYGKLADQLRKAGFPVIGGSLFGDQIQLDRLYGRKVMQLMGIDAPKMHTFSDYAQAIEFVKTEGKVFVLEIPGLTYTARGVDDMIDTLKFHCPMTKHIRLYEKIDGIEVSTEVWFNGKEVLNVNHTFEEKALMDGGLGIKTRSMGSVVCIGSQGTRLYEEGIGKIIPALRKNNYRGAISLNSLVTKDRVYGCAFTADFGSVSGFLELHKGRVNDLLYGIATGVTKSIGVNHGWALGVMMHVEPRYTDTLIQGFNKHNLKHIWMHDIYKRDQYYGSGGGLIGIVTARGDTVREAKRRVYRTLSNLIVPDVMYRKDIGDRVSNDYAQLKEQGWV